TDNIVLDVRMGAYVMGDEVRTAQPKLEVVVLGTNLLDKVEVLRDGEVVHTERPAAPAAELRFAWEDPRPRRGEKASYYYVRVQQFSEEGVYLYQRGEYQNARECFEVALQLQPADANLMFNVGQCYDHQGKADKALEYYQLCLSRSGNHARCRHSLALLLFRI